MARVTVADDEVQLAAIAALRITSLIERAIAARGSAVLCLSGGRTPERLYEALADQREPWRTRIDWSRVHVFWSDERQVPPDHPDSNYAMAERTLLSRVSIPPERIHRMEGELLDAREAARRYEADLRDRTLDVALLGIGEDAHIASIFPGSPLLDDRGPQGSAPHPVNEGGAGLHGPRVAAVWVPLLNAWRMTLTPLALLEARAMLVMASGPKKADAARAALTLPDDVMRYPAQLLRRAEDRVEWIIDRAAARWLDAPHAQ